MQTPQQSVSSEVDNANLGGFGGGGFGNVDFFMSGTLDSRKDEEEEEKLSVVLTGAKDMFEIQESHYHVKPYKVEKFSKRISLLFHFAQLFLRIFLIFCDLFFRKFFVFCDFFFSHFFILRYFFFATFFTGFFVLRYFFSAFFF